MGYNDKITSYIEKHLEFGDILQKLRSILLHTSFTETVKWDFPNYTFQNINLRNYR